MRKNTFAFPTLVAVMLFSGVILAQDPVQDIDAKAHPNLAAAQFHVVEANKAVALAQRDNRYDMKGHCDKARQLLIQANNELKAAAEAANASAAKKK